MRIKYMLIEKVSYLEVLQEYKLKLIMKVIISFCSNRCNILISDCIFYICCFNKLIVINYNKEKFIIFNYRNLIFSVLIRNLLENKNYYDDIKKNSYKLKHSNLYYVMLALININIKERGLMT